jgi:hypothetical protein
LRLGGVREFVREPVGGGGELVLKLLQRGSLRLLRVGLAQFTTLLCSQNTN